jgi:hypothetical protein
MSDKLQAARDVLDILSEGLAAAEMLGRACGPAIQVWRFDDAPASLRKMSPHGGDEDWIAFIPGLCHDRNPLWAEEGTPFGCCSVSRHELPSGAVVLIGAHA